MNINLIRRIIKEETTIKKNLQNLIDNFGLKQAISAVNGIDNLIEILYDGDIQQFGSIVQKMINETLDELWEHCDTPDAENFPDWISFDDCDTHSVLEKIEVVNIKKTSEIRGIEMKYPTINTYVNIYFNTQFAGVYFDDFLISLSDRIQKKYKIVLLFKENNLINVNTNLQEQISRIHSMMGITTKDDENTNNTIKNLILNGNEFDDWIEAVRLKYGDTVSLFHATTKQNAKIIDKEGFKLTQGKNYISFSSEPFIYFQLGKSTYESTNRPVIYKIEVPVEFLYNSDIDMDTISVSNKELSKYFDLNEFEDIPSDMRDAIIYYIGNNFELDGTELIFTDRYSGDRDIFKNIRPIKLS